MRKYIRKNKPYNDETIKAALEEVRAGGQIMSTAKKYNMSRNLLHQRYKLFKETGTHLLHDRRGRSTVLKKEIETKLANLLRQMEDMCISPTLKEFQNLVTSYIVGNNINNPFKGRKPGKDWLSSFLNRHNFNLKRNGIMRLQRECDTPDPFVIFGNYDALELEMKKLGIMDSLGLWNCEVSFSEDSTKTKSIGTGIYPLVRHKFDVSIFDEIKYQAYQEWRENGAQTDDKGNLILVKEEILAPEDENFPEEYHNSPVDVNTSTLFTSENFPDEYPNSPVDVNTLTLFTPVPKSVLLASTTSTPVTLIDSASSLSDDALLEEIMKRPIGFSILYQKMQQMAPKGLRYVCTLELDKTSTKALAS